MYKFPFASTARPLMSENEADVAGPPSPLNPSWPLTPATVDMIPVLVVTLRTTSLVKSPMK